VVKFDERKPGRGTGVDNIYRETLKVDSGRCMAVFLQGTAGNESESKSRNDGASSLTARDVDEDLEK
jgi:hypothetical protein